MRSRAARTARSWCSSGPISTWCGPAMRRRAMRRPSCAGRLGLLLRRPAGVEDLRVRQRLLVVQSAVLQHYRLLVEDALLVYHQVFSEDVGHLLADRIFRLLAPLGPDGYVVGGVHLLLGLQLIAGALHGFDQALRQALVFRRQQLGPVH